MRDAIGKFISQTKMNRDTIRQLAAMLPTDDAELDALLSQLVAEKHSSHFVCVVVAALHNERVLDARHLELGGYMLSAGPLLQKFGWSAKGDVPRYLLNAIKGGNMITHQLVIAALLLIVLWCKEHQQSLPDDFLEAARKNIRSADARKTFPQMLSALAYEMNDEVSITIMEEECEVSKKERDDCLADFLEHCRGPAINLITDTSGQTVATGITMRRAVEKIGRNDPCPCGSGKKYKQCCIAKDQERLRRSSPIAGLTNDELRTAPEKGLTKDLLNRIFAVNLMQYDPLRIPKEIFPDYLDRLTVCKCFDRGAEAFEKVGFSKELDAAWHNMAFFAAQVQRKDIIDRLFAVRPDAAEIEDEVHMSIGLLRGEGKPERILEILEHCANNSVKVNEADNYKGYAWGMLVSKYPGMAIIVARSVIPLIPTKEATFIYEYLLQVRDKMKLTGEEPFGDILDERIRKENSNERSLQDASQKLEDKAREVRRLNEAVHQLQRDLELREKRAEQAAKAPAAAAIEQRATDTLREKMVSLKEELKRQHNERNELRRELQQAQQNLEELQAQPKSNVVNLPVKDGEDDMVLPEENNSVQPVRLIEFPNKFQETLNGLPKHVARAAMTTIGRLAAGEPAAFVGVVRLKLCPNILRQRIGIDHRLLFRLQPGYVEVIDLINRRDLERRVKALI